MEALEELAVAQPDRVGGSALEDGLAQRGHVAPDVRYADLAVAPRGDDVRAELATQVVERLAQRVARALLRKVRPEEGEEVVAAVEAEVLGDGQVYEECKPLLLP